MRLVTKLVVLLVLGMTGLLALDAFLSIRREISIVDEDMRLDARHIGNAIRTAVERVREVEGADGSRRVLDGLALEPHAVRVRWVWLDAPPEDPHLPSVPAEALAPLLRGQELSIRSDSPDGGPFLHTYVPLPSETERTTALEISESLQPLNERVRALIVRGLGLVLGVVALGALLVVVAGVRLVGTPLRALLEKIRRTSSGDLSAPIVLHNGDELDEVAMNLNEMCERLAESQQRTREETAKKIEAVNALRHADRLRTVGRLAAGVAHELGTPLNVVSGRAAEIAGGGLTSGETEASAAIIRSQAERITRTVRQLLDFARRGSPTRDRVDLRECARRTVSLLAPLGRVKGVEVRMAAEDAADGAGDAGVFALADGAQIDQVLTNLVANAVHATPPGGQVRVGMERQRAHDPSDRTGRETEYVRMYVEDDGHGIAEADIQRLFEPFYTTKDVGEGTGLGLSIVYSIVEDHGGWIDVTSTPGVGSRFSVYLPQLGAATPVEAA